MMVQINIGKRFQRVYYETTIITLRELRGSVSLEELAKLAVGGSMNTPLFVLHILNNNVGINPESTCIRLNQLLLCGPVVPNEGTHELQLGNLKFEMTIRQD